MNDTPGYITVTVKSVSSTRTIPKGKREKKLTNTQSSSAIRALLVGLRDERLVTLTSSSDSPVLGRLAIARFRL